jgi:hypothetical protein
MPAHLREQAAALAEQMEKYPDHYVHAH